MSVLLPKITYAIPFIQFPYPLTHSVMRQMKRLIIYPLRRSLGLPNNAHHDSIFIESRILSLPYLIIYHSILFARRYIKQAATPHEAAQRYRDMFMPNSLLLLSIIRSNEVHCYPMSIHSPSYHIHIFLPHLNRYRIWSLGISIMYGVHPNIPPTLVLSRTLSSHVIYTCLHATTTYFHYI